MEQRPESTIGREAVRCRETAGKGRFLALVWPCPGGLPPVRPRLRHRSARAATPVRGGNPGIRVQSTCKWRCEATRVRLAVATPACSSLVWGSSSMFRSRSGGGFRRFPRRASLVSEYCKMRYIALGCRPSPEKPVDMQISAARQSRRQTIRRHRSHLDCSARRWSCGPVTRGERRDGSEMARRLLGQTPRIRRKPPEAARNRPESAALCQTEASPTTHPESALPSAHPITTAHMLFRSDETAPPV